jgi:hypothetical protein
LLTNIDRMYATQLSFAPSLVCFQWPNSPCLGQSLFITEASPSHSIWHTLFGRTPLDEWSARYRDLYLITHNTHKRQTSMPPPGFELKIPTNDQPQAHALDRAATEIGNFCGSITKESAVNYCPIMLSFYALDPRLRLLRHLVRCSRELVSSDRGSTFIRPYIASTVLLHWWVAETWRSLFPLYTSSTFYHHVGFKHFHVLFFA